MVTPRREASPTVGFIDNYCQAYQNLFSDVRNYEVFKLLHLGMLSEIPRKSLPKIAKAVGLKDSQGLNYFLKEADWDVEKVKEVRLWLTKLLIGEREIILCLDETGDAKKGKATDYVAKQYIGNLGKTKNGIVSVNAYAVVEGITYPLLFKIFWFIMTNKKGKITSTIASEYSLRNWIEYAFKQVKNELGWAD